MLPPNDKTSFASDLFQNLALCFTLHDRFC